MSDLMRIWKTALVKTAVVFIILPEILRRGCLQSCELPMTTRLLNYSFVLLTIFCIGCSASPARTSNLCFWCTESAPTDRVTQADIAIRAAVDAKAADFSPIELQSARDKLSEARRMIAAEKHTQARRLAERAQVDAELAEAKAETVMMRRTADQILRRVEIPPTEAERDSRKPLTPMPELK